jgi:hypothetical protein
MNGMYIKIYLKKNCAEFQSIIQPKILNKTTENSTGNWPKFEQDLPMNRSSLHSVAITSNISGNDSFIQVMGWEEGHAVV